MSLEELRRQYTLGGLTRKNLPSSPFEFFADWMQTALDQAPADWVEPYAMTLATSSTQEDVSARIVLLRGHDEAGFVFYTNYDSAKGQQLADNASAALTFYWGYLERQVRVRGKVKRTAREPSERYFHKRPRGSQISAAISPQSQTVSSREWLEQQAHDYETQLGQDAEVPLPDNWGGYVLEPQEIEFWQGRQNRLHDRILYQRQDDGSWEQLRLAP